jgi:drug/metabolite transporter (DMT)-like permease
LIAIPLATVLLARGPRVLPSADVSMFFMLETVLTPVWIWLLFGEVPSQRVLLGGAVVVAALLAHSWWRLCVSLRPSPATA